MSFCVCVCVCILYIHVYVYVDVSCNDIDIDIYIYNTYMCIYMISYTVNNTLYIYMYREIVKYLDIQTNITA